MVRKSINAVFGDSVVVTCVLVLQILLLERSLDFATRFLQRAVEARLLSAEVQCFALIGYIMMVLFGRDAMIREIKIQDAVHYVEANRRT